MTTFGPVAVEFTINRNVFISFLRELNSDSLKIELLWIFAKDGLYGYTLRRSDQIISEYGEGMLRKSYIPVEEFDYYASRKTAQWDPHHPEPPFFERTVKFRGQMILALDPSQYKRDVVSIFIDIDRSHLTVDFTPDLPINVGHYMVHGVELLKITSKEFNNLHEIYT